MKYAWIDEHRDPCSVARLCRQLDVSRTGYCQWRGRPESNRALANSALDVQAASASCRFLSGRFAVGVGNRAILRVYCRATTLFLRNADTALAGICSF